MIKSYHVIVKLIDRYDYGGALEVLAEQGLENTDVAILIDSCRYAVNFDFRKAKRILGDLSPRLKENTDVIKLEKNLQELYDGDPNAIFSELLENIKFQIVNEEFIDFLGRVYRCKEAIFKYIFVKKHRNLKRFSLLIDIMQKRNILKILRKKYKIFNSNLVYGITTYINRNLKNEPRYMDVARILNSDKMNELIELRNSSIVGHGFMGVSIDDIYKAYGNPYNVLDDFKACFAHLDIKLNRYKYSQINDMIKNELDRLNQGMTVHTMKETAFE